MKEYSHLLFPFFFSPRLAHFLFPSRIDYKQDKTNDGAVKTRELLVGLSSVISHSGVREKVRRKVRNVTLE